MSPFLKITAAAGALLASAPLALALECSKPEPLDATQKAPDLAVQLASPQILAQVPGIYGALRAQFPKASKAQIVDYLVTSYCPVVKAQSGLSAQEQDAKVKSFADAAVNAAF